MSAPSSSFAARLLAWHALHGRHDLPWQHPRTPYRVWLSEVMLQQTQVSTVIPYFERFIARFPDVATLAAAPIDEVLALWAGLGYYARARNLHRCAQHILQAHEGRFPETLEGLQALPGVGRSTAGAILAQAYGMKAPILDGNVRRLLARHAGIEGWPGELPVQKKLWAIAEAHLPDLQLADYTQALMDLGASLCTPRRPQCPACPLREDCVAYREGRVAALPTPRPKRQRPQRQAHLLLIENAQGQILLQRRPPTGIWGGLWCPPVLTLEQDPLTHCRDRLSLSAQHLETLPTVHHAFTHFDLALLPLRLRVTEAAPADEEYSWTTMADFDKGLPAPVRKLFTACQAQIRLHLETPSCPEPSTA